MKSKVGNSWKPGPLLGARAAGAVLGFALAAVLIGLLVGAPASRAQDYDSYDPPIRVARVNFLQGSVSFQPGGVDEWVEVNPNRPLTTGDALWTDADSRAELHVGSTSIRLNQYSSFALLNLSNDTVQMQLTSGSLNLRIRNLYPGENYEVDTPNLAFTALEVGEYRVDTDPDSGLTTVTVRSGEGQVTGGGQSFCVDPRTQAQVSGSDQIYYDIYDLPQPDGFDAWALNRDRREDHSLAARYVSRDLTGYEELDQYGSWANVPNLGPVWQPRSLPDGWAPVRAGHWAWVDPWGWTWVDDAPWGFVTSHYGRWTYLGNGWAWVPPGFNAGTPYSNENRPVYAPSLVVFLGGSLGFGGNGEGVAWVALGPGEPYVPSYQVSPTYITRINVTNTVIQQTTITNVVNNINNTTIVNNNTTVVYANQRVANAVTAVPKAAFVNAQPVAKAAVAVSVQQATAARSMAVVKVAPVQASVLGKPQGTATNASKPPAAVASKAVVAKVAPPPPPVAFAQKQQALAANPGRPVSQATVKTLAAANPPPVRVVKAAPAAPPVKAAPAQVHKAPPPIPAAAPVARPGSPAAIAAAKSVPKPGNPPPAANNPPAKPVPPPAANTPPARTVPPPANNPPAKPATPPATNNAPAKPAAPPAANNPPPKPAPPPPAREQQPPERPATPPPASRTNPPPPAQREPQAAAAPSQPVHVAENVQQGKLVSQPKLVYPPEAQRAHVQGAVQVQAVIGADGRVKSAHAVSGPPALQAAAVSNVNGRQYSPTMVGGKAVEVTTEVTVNFTAPK